jgi:hypothetical protein
LIRVFNLTCCLFVQRGLRSDHHGHDGQDSLDATSTREVDQRDREADEPVAQYDQEVVEGTTPE